MNDALKRYVEAATGLGNLTKARAERVARQLVKQGEAASDQVGELVDELLERQRKNREAITEMVRAETKRVVRRMGLATTSEVERLETEVSELKQELDQARSSATAKKTATRKKSGRKKATKKSASKKQSSKKQSSKKATEKKGTAKKKASKKKATKKSPAKKSPAKKAAKRTAAKKTAKKAGEGS